MPLSSYILPVAGSTALMAFSWALGRFDYSISWIVIFVALNFLKSKMWKQREKRLLALRATSLREKEIVEATMTDMPTWVQFPDTERVEWINKVILQAWPYIGEYAKKYIKEQIEPTVKQSMPSPFKAFQFDHIDMGDVPMRVQGIKVYTENVGRDKIIMDMDVAYAGDCEFITSVGAFKAGMNNLQFTGKLRCNLAPLIAYPPMVGAVSAFFLDNPRVDFNLTGLGEMVELPGLMAAVRAVVQQQMSAICVLPNKIVVPLVPTVDKLLLQFPEPDGVIRLHVVGARDLENKDISFIKKGRSDPYAVITLGNQIFTTKVIDNNLNPVWNEFYEATVAEASGQRLRVELYDEDQGKDEELGRVSLEMSQVRDRGTIDKWFDLDGAESGSLHLKIYWMSLSRNPRDLEVDQWESEWLKANRTMHSAMLMVYVDNATDMPFPKVGVEPSPYITLELGQEKKETTQKFKTINPEWGEKFIFFVSHPESQQMKVEARDVNTKRNLGTCVVSLSPLLSERNMEFHQKHFSLQLGTHETRLTMTVRLRPLRGRPPTAREPIDINVQSASTNNGSDQIVPQPIAQPESGYGTLESKPPVPPHKTQQTQYLGTNNNGAQLDPLYSSINGYPDDESYMTGSLDRSMLKKQRGGFMNRMRQKKHRINAGRESFISDSMRSLAIGTCGKLHIGLRYDFTNHALVVNVYRAIRVPSIDYQGSADPYCQIKVTSRVRDHIIKHKTSIVEHSLEPVWDESFEFDILQQNLPEYNVIFKLKDGAAFGVFARPPVLGRYLLNLADFKAGHEIESWYDLEPPELS